MPEESSLRSAIDKIMGWPAGGEGGGAVKATTPPATSIALANDVAALPPDPFAAELSSLQAQNAALSTQLAAPAAAPEAAPAAAAPLGPDYKSYNEYYADNPEALEKAGYGYWYTPGEPLDTTSGVGADWANGNPYQYRNEYNEYLGTLPYEYQLLGQNNITGEAVKAGSVTGIYDKASGQTYSVGPDVAPGTVKAGSVATPTAASALTKPVNPGPRAPWQQSQQYWKDLDAYTKTGGQ